MASRRRQDLLELLDQVDATIAELTASIEQEAEKRPEVVRLMTHPGVGALTALAFVLILGTPDRFARSKQVSSYLGLVPTEESSGERRHLGHISKQGSTLLRFLLVAAAQVTARSDPDWKRCYQPSPSHACYPFRFIDLGWSAVLSSALSFSVVFMIVLSKSAGERKSKLAISACGNENGPR